MHPISRRHLIGAALAGTALSRTAGATEELTCGIVDAPPWVLREGELPGIGVELVRQLSRHAGLPIRAQTGPPIRLIKGVRAGLVDMIAYVQAPALESAARSLGAVGQVDMGAVPRPGLSLRRPADFAGCMLGMVRGNNRPAVLDGLPSLTRVEVRDLSQGLAMVAGGRLDALMGSRLALTWHIRQGGYPAGTFGPFFRLLREPMMLYLGTLRPYPAETVQRLVRALPPTGAALAAIYASYLGAG